MSFTCLPPLHAAAGRPQPSFVPEWARRVVWYQIFPERFRNGDLRSNPRLEDQQGAYPHDLRQPWQIHPWMSDWYELQPYERANGKGFWFNVHRRRYGGDLQGIIDKLDYLQDLGVTALYLNPVFASPSHHKYDSIVYHHVDPNLGPDPDGDRALMASETPGDPATWHWTAADRLALRLIDEVHRRKMYLIFDGVFNHIGAASPFFRDIEARQQQSIYADWFCVRSWADAACGTKLEYEGWEGYQELPSWRQDAQGTVAGPKRYIFDITRRWMDPSGQGRPEEGIDGWRLDVAYCIKHPFWKDWSRHVRSINPNAYLTAEIIDTVEVNRPFLEGDEFSAVMNYNFAFACAEFFFPSMDPLPPTAFDEKLRLLREAYPPEVAYGMQNLLDSHDSARLASNIINADVVRYREWHAYCEKSQARNPRYDPRGPTPAERRIQKLAVLLQMTYVGAPMVYYGDEVGMWGARDPCCRKPMVWDDMTYADEALLPDGTLRKHPDRVAVDTDMLEHYRRCIGIRNALPALQIGDYQTLLADDAAGVFAFQRSTADESVLVVVNRSGEARHVTLPVAAGVYNDVLNGGETCSTAAQCLALEVAPQWGAVLVKE